VSTLVSAFFLLLLEAVDELAPLRYLAAVRWYGFGSRGNIFNVIISASYDGASPILAWRSAIQERKLDYKSVETRVLPS